MAVKPITNPFPRQGDQVNRAKQVSVKEFDNRISNREKSVIPGKDFTKNNQIILKDLDTVIMTHIKNVMKVSVNENNEMIKVPLFYGNEERWKNVRKNGVLRDKNGSLILPSMVFKRTTLEFNEELPSYKHDLTKQFVQVTRSSTYSKDNRYDRFAIQTGKKPVTDSIVTGLPEYVNAVYEFITFTQFMEQMNGITEAFVEQHNTYWGDNTSYKFHCRIDGGISDASEISVDADRAIKNTFIVNLKGYLIPQVLSNLIETKKFNAQKTFTKSKITFNEIIE
tara:strand:- start:3723 stop:4565 length:843 start_codon:yes stop_codon:yes gene_type:complete